MGEVLKGGEAEAVGGGGRQQGERGRPCRFSMVIKWGEGGGEVAGEGKGEGEGERAREGRLTGRNAVFVRAMWEEEEEAERE